MEQRFDGQEVAVFDAKFAGTFDLPHDVGVGMGMFDEQEYVFTVTVTPKSASFGETRQGDLKRTNTLQVVKVEYQGAGLHEPVIGVDSLEGQQSVYDVLGMDEEEVAEIESAETEAELLALAGVPEEEPVKREPFRAPIPTSRQPIRSYDHDEALKGFLQ